MEHRRHADDGRCAADLVAHGVLGRIDIAVDRRQRAVVADGAAEHIGNAALFAAVDDAVVDVFVLDEICDAAVIAHAVDGVKMMIVAVRHGALRVDVLPERRLKVGRLQIVCGQRVARQNGVNIAVFDQLGHGRAGVMVKGEGRTHDPDDLAVVTLVAQQVIQLVIIAGEGRLTRAVLAEGKRLLFLLLLAEAVRVHIDAVCSILGPAGEHQIALAQQAELADDNAAVFIHGNAVHAAFLCKEPLAVHLEILGENAHGVVMLRRNAVKRGGHADGIRRVLEALLGKIRRKIRSELEHGLVPLGISNLLLG